MSYLREIQINWRSLTAASLGLASGYTLNLYVSNIFAPHLLAEFGWSRSQFALIGMSVLLGVVTLPIVGRFTDVIGVRRMAMGGIILTPIIYVAYSMIGPSFPIFLMLNLFHVAAGAVTTSLVYSRLIAESFDRARGLALALAACAAPAAGAIIAPFLSDFIQTNGWRAGYLALAAGTAIAGALTLVFMPGKPAKAGEETPVNSGPSGAAGYRDIFANPAFQKIAAGMFLCNLTMMVQTSQLGLILSDRDASAATAATMLSVYAGGIVIGRLICGLALDRYPTHIVAAISLGLPCAGLLILASGTTMVPLLGIAVLAVGLAMGAELDVLAYLVMRYFKVGVYSSVYGLIQPVIALSAATGSLLLSVTLGLSGGFNQFLYLAAASTLIGCFAFLTLAREHQVPGQAAEMANS